MSGMEALIALIVAGIAAASRVVPDMIRGIRKWADERQDWRDGDGRKGDGRYR